MALSLGLVGALSIVRFRTPIKEPEELAYLFISIAAGLGLGANQTIPTIVSVIFILVSMTILKFRKVDGFPDGMTTDRKNNLWVCHYAGGCISVYNLKGKKIHKIYLPAKNITNCTFGGSKYNELYVSTARKDLKIKDIKKYPLSGSLFKIKMNIKGKATQSFKLS